MYKDCVLRKARQSCRPLEVWTTVVTDTKGPRVTRARRVSQVVRHELSTVVGPRTWATSRRESGTD